MHIRDNFLKGLISCIPSSCSWPLIMSLYINFNNTSKTKVLGASQNKHLRQLHLYSFSGVILDCLPATNNIIKTTSHQISIILSLTHKLEDDTLLENR